MNESMGNDMKKVSILGDQFAPAKGGQFASATSGQFCSKLVVNLNWNQVVNFTVFSNQSIKSA